MLFGWMKSLIFYLMLATIVPHMAPSNQYKQYIRYFIGLVVIVLLASPLKFLFEFGSGDLQELLQEIEHVEGQESVAGVGGSITDYYGMGIREGLKKELQGYSVEDVAIITDAGGELLQCTIYISEAKATEEESPEWGNQEVRGISMEIQTAAASLASGSDAVILKHPQSVATISKMIQELM